MLLKQHCSSFVQGNKMRIFCSFNFLWGGRVRYPPAALSYPELWHWAGTDRSQRICFTMPDSKVEHKIRASRFFYSSAITWNYLFKRNHWIWVRMRSIHSLCRSLPSAQFGLASEMLLHHCNTSELKTVYFHPQEKQLSKEAFAGIAFI